MVPSIKPIAAGKHELEQRFGGKLNDIAVDLSRPLAQGKRSILFRSSSADEGFRCPVKFAWPPPRPTMAVAQDI